MDNYQIADSFSLLSKLTDIHGENSFKAKSYASAAFAIEKLTGPLTDIPKEKIAGLKGISTSTAQKIIELIETGKIIALEEIVANTPPGIIEMLRIKGIGPKKINTIWKEMEIETIGELLYACKENRLKLFKGFGEKTQQTVIDSIEFYFKNKGSHLFAQVALIENDITSFIKNIFSSTKVALTGAFQRQLEIIDHLEYLAIASEEEIIALMNNAEGFTFHSKEECLLYNTIAGIDVKIFPTDEQHFHSRNIQLSSSEAFWNELSLLHCSQQQTADSEAVFFSKINLPFIPPYLREDFSIVSDIKNNGNTDVIQPNDIKGIIHCHSNWSDGNNTIEEMAVAAMQAGLEYMVISDHSKTAFYAQGLPVEKVLAQHQLIDELNEKLHPFKIFKSIESDILNDGSLDYSNDILSRFDMVIASVHSNLKMPEEKAMMRLLNAIENPYTTILGHMTGRLLLSRPGYPVDHKKIIDACAANNVAIELNAHPSRLDIDWRHIQYAIKKNVLISIDPDAHSIEGYQDIKYGVLVAQKAMLKKEQNLSSFSLQQMEQYIAAKKNK
jgi:DNA polymerase (family 10)